MDNLIIGSYVPGTSVVHRLDARVKLILALLLMVVVFLAKGYAGLALCSVFVLGFFALAGISFPQALKSIAPLLFIVLLTALLNLFFVKGGTVYFSWWVVCVSSEGIARAAFMAWRLTLLLLVMSLLTLSTAMLDLTTAFELLFSPFKRIGLPAHELAMMMGIVLRFLPQFVTELQVVRKAQLSRGASFSKGKISTISSLIMPLFASAYRHGETLSAAMESRCYHGGEGRTRLHPLAFMRLDAVAICVCLLMLACVVGLRIVLGG